MKKQDLLKKYFYPNSPIKLEDINIQEFEADLDSVIADSQPKSKNRKITVALLRDLISDVTLGRKSFSRMVEILNEKIGYTHNEKPTAHEWYNPETGHCYVDYIERPDLGTEKEGYVKTPLFKHPSAPLTPEQLGAMFDKNADDYIYERGANGKANKALEVIVKETFIRLGQQFRGVDLREELMRYELWKNIHTINTIESYIEKYLAERKEVGNEIS